MQKNPMSRFGFEKLSAELEELKTKERPANIAEIDLARSHGDLKENAEYHAARERQRIIESRIAELGALLASAVIIDPQAYTHEVVKFGSSVVIVDLESEKESKYTIVGVSEGDVGRGYISISSPLAKAMLGRGVGEEFRVSLPRGEGEFEILSIAYEGLDFS